MRSVTGCWTCRLRRKKCDELRPGCTNCKRLRIRCSYGKKPEYMDGGLKEKKKAEEIKNAIKAADTRKRRPHHSDTGKKLQFTVYEKPPLASLLQDNSIIHPPPEKTSALDHISARNSNNSSVAEPIQQPDEINKSPIVTTDLPTSCRQNSFEGDKSFSSLYMVFEDDLPLNTYTLKHTELSSTKTHPGYSFDALLDPTLLPLTSVQTPSKDNLDFWDALLLVHYIDHVLYVQFPFYNDSLSHHGRGWVTSLVTEVKPIYYTALALSSYHRDMENFKGDEATRFELYWKYHARALIELRYYINNASDSGGVEYAYKVSFCILQLIFCEIFRGQDNWQMHLQAATGLIASLATSKPKITTLFFEQRPSKSTGIEILRNANFGDRLGPDAMKENAIDTIVGTFVALDILSSASTRSPSLLQADHKYWLSDRNIQMHHLIGCDESVMLLISQITAVEEWKRDCEAKCSLSIMELSKRASWIETALEEFIIGNSLEVEAAIPALRLRYPTVIPASGTSKLNTRVVSSVFALSAITYLHVVVSGAHPDLKEIRQSVFKTVLILKSLPDPRLLRCMAWPFCVTGCLAPKELENELRDLAISAGASETGPGSLWKSLKIMEDCWNRRDQERGSQDWTAAMSRLGDKVLLY